MSSAWTWGIVSAMTNEIPELTLNNGVEMPVVRLSRVFARGLARVFPAAIGLIGSTRETPRPRGRRSTRRSAAAPRGRFG